MHDEIINICITGQGGQGVNTLYRLILQMCAENNFYSKSYLLKGGAQRHGSVLAGIRIFINYREDYQWYSSQIGRGEANIIIGMDPIEALRQSKLVGKQTTLWVNDNSSPNYAERLGGPSTKDARTLFDKLKCSRSIKNYSAEAKERFGEVKMANFLILKDVIDSGLLPFDSEYYSKCFVDMMKERTASAEHLNKMMR